MRYIVTKSFRPKGSNGPTAAIGTELDLGADQARVFKALHWIEAAPAPEPVQYTPRQVVEHEVETAVVAKRTYRTRRMKAEAE